jgi:hypothetical protein
MKLPTFKPSKRFLGDINLSCLVAKIKNSKLPGVAARHVAEFKDDRACKIYLRGKNPKKISAWQQEILEQLFVEEGLAPAIEEAMKDYGKDPDAYSDCSAKEQKEIKKHGIAPFIWLSVIVIDEIKKEVIFNGGCERGVHITEHGLSVYLRKGRWRWDEADYFIRYHSGFEEDRPTTPAELATARSKLVDEMAAEFEALGSGQAEMKKRWNKVFPPPPPGTPVQKDMSFLYGDWRFDAVETAKVLKRLGEEKSVAECREDWGSDRIRRFSEKVATEFQDGDLIGELHIRAWEHRGNRITQYYRGFGGLLLRDGTSEFWVKGNLLVDQNGLAYRRVT